MLREVPKMRRLNWLVFSCLLVVSAECTPSLAKTEDVTIKSGTETISGYLVMPDTAGPHPAIVVIHEWWGLNDWVKEQTKKFADQGFAALAVDLYRGKVATDADTAHQLMRGLPQDRAVRDMKAAFAYLASRPEVNKNKIGSVGWCMGGGLSLQLAIHEPKLAACAMNYGSMPTDAGEIAKIQAPILGNFGAEDQGITPDDVHTFENAMKAAHKSVDMKIYNGAGHAFENPNNKGGYRPEAAADAWSRMVAFFDKTLK
jgi:carboxymethylenebutenolidase